jgi:homoserine O-acetyltransferase/O-succinyltransferase
MLRIALLLLVAFGTLGAQDGRQLVAALGDLKLESGEVIRDCRIGYRTYGRLDASQSNAILFPTWFGGTTAQLASNFGPGQMVDTGRYFVIAVDAIGNGVSTSPSNSTTQARMKFPRFSIRDMVESQHRLVTEVLHLKHLRAVMGISMGGMQTFEWMVAYPDFMDRAIPIVGTPRLMPFDVLLWEAEIHAIEADANWKNGDYAARPAAALRTVSDIHNLALATPAYYGRQNAGKDMSAVLAAAEKATVEQTDANDYYRQLQAMLAHDIYRHFGGDRNRAAAVVHAKVTVIVAAQDHMVNPEPALEFAKALQVTLRVTMRVTTVELSGDCGHISPGCEGSKVAGAVAQALR